MTLKKRHHELSRDTKIIEKWHQELHQLCTGKSTKVRILCWKSETFSTREAAFACRIFPTHFKVIHKSRTLRERISSATTSVSRFAGRIFGLARIFVGKAEKNYLNTLASRSHNSHPSSDSCKLDTIGKNTSQDFQRY